MPLSVATIGESASSAQLLPLVYEELRRLAAGRMARESAAQTFQPTELAHEAWLRLAGIEGGVWQNRAHFFGAAAQAMRRILVDRAGAARDSVEFFLEAREGSSVVAGDILDEIPVDELPHAPQGAMIGEGPGTRIDRYRLLERIGEGGCGVVYQAEQEQPVRRLVALKIIRSPGFVKGRFGDHPGGSGDGDGRRACRV